MKDLDVERALRRYAEDLVSRYTWLTIRFEYSEKRSVYLVSYSPRYLISGKTALINEMMDFEDRMNDVYGDDAPLFCKDEELFKLSPEAEVIRHRPLGSLAAVPVSSRSRAPVRLHRGQANR